ncbi:hypothetical protein [Aulosira sp. FACHB-615]|uniref:hypothetical protein n=1 Tax=Aulosira sp. FACHB-615 TaxID=2692777 RepID=UPI00168A377B|nr:hypothetical protein [Aulosira sp. FACHB-615]MBD2492314.1 hypothetical protein [Aulosira sp. FACHB-615]
MAKVVDYYVERTAARLLRSLKGSGGAIPLHQIQFSNTIIQYLLDKKQAQIKNTGHGFLLAVVEKF